MTEVATAGHTCAITSGVSVLDAPDQMFAAALHS